MQVESVKGLKGCQPFNVVLLDEIEAILSTFSGKTMEDRLMTVCTVLADIVQKADYVFVADAFTSNRTLHFLEGALAGTSRRILCRMNTSQPYNREVCIAIISFEKLRVCDVNRTNFFDQSAQSMFV